LILQPKFGSIKVSALLVEVSDARCRHIRMSKQSISFSVRQVSIFNLRDLTLSHSSAILPSHSSRS